MLLCGRGLGIGGGLSQAAADARSEGDEEGPAERACARAAQSVDLATGAGHGGVGLDQQRRVQQLHGGNVGLVAEHGGEAHVRRPH